MQFYRIIAKPLWHMLRQSQRTRGLWVMLSMVISAFLDFFSLASFLPLVVLIINPEITLNSTFINGINSIFGFQSHAGLIVALTIVLLVLALVKNAFSMAITRMKANYVFLLGSDLSSRMLSRYMELSYLKFTNIDFAKELNRIANQPIAFANNIIMPLANLMSEGVVLLLLLCSVAFFNIGVFAFTIVLLLPIAAIYRLKRSYIRQTSQALKEQYPLTLKYGLQIVEGLNDIRASGKESFFKQRFNKASAHLADTFSKDHVTQTSTTRLTEIITALIICALIIFTVLTNENYQNTLLLLSVYAGASFRIIPSLNRIFHATLQIKTHQYLFGELELNTLSSTDESKAIKKYEFSKQIELKDLSYAYDSTEVLSNVSFVLNKGDKIALVGKSGSGKTTLILILMQLLREYSGAILIDGETIQRNDNVRHLFGYVPQHPYILDASIAENIAFGVPDDEIDTNKVERIISDLDLGSLLNREDGILTMIGERGIKLSGGQRQRIAIARALYAGTEILVLDEITNQLDITTEKTIIQTLERVALKQKTILMITHHERLLKHFDRAVRIENGKLTEGHSVKLETI